MSAFAFGRTWDMNRGLLGGTSCHRHTACGGEGMWIGSWRTSRRGVTPEGAHGLQQTKTTVELWGLCFIVSKVPPPLPKERVPQDPSGRHFLLPSSSCLTLCKDSPPPTPPFTHCWMMTGHFQTTVRAAAPNYWRSSHQRLFHVVTTLIFGAGGGGLGEVGVITNSRADERRESDSSACKKKKKRIDLCNQITCFLCIMLCW